ncbi:hypothetical protein ACF3M2_13890 [Tissierella carlieri]|uniref:hypothetical protein n=1 Tax=Tissierella carlieri TaxID=689904 RepID=UPI0038650C18
MKKKLEDILKPYDNWFNDSGEEKNNQAREALHTFYTELLKYKPSKIYESRDGMHTSYIRFLVVIKKAFMEGKYMRVCNELFSLIHYEPFCKVGFILI